MKVSPLRQRMLDVLQMRGSSPSTVKTYIHAVEYLSRHYRRSPDQISPAEIQKWLLWMQRERNISPSTYRQYFNGVRFLYVFVLEDSAFSDYRFILPKRQQRLPDLFHLVFTLPHELNGWVRLHPRVIYAALFSSVWDTLNTLGHDPKRLAGQLGMTAAVLHTWGQNLSQHVHLHCLIRVGRSTVSSAGIRQKVPTCFPVGCYPVCSAARWSVD